MLAPWVIEEMKDAELGDKRLNDRLGVILDQLGGHVQGLPRRERLFHLHPTPLVQHPGHLPGQAPKGLRYRRESPLGEEMGRQSPRVVLHQSTRPMDEQRWTTAEILAAPEPRYKQHADAQG